MAIESGQLSPDTQRDLGRINTGARAEDRTAPPANKHFAENCEAKDQCAHLMSGRHRSSGRIHFIKSFSTESPRSTRDCGKSSLDKESKPENREFSSKNFVEISKVTGEEASFQQKFARHCGKKWSPSKCGISRDVRRLKNHLTLMRGAD
jgi:hypothetical protein